MFPFLELHDLTEPFFWVLSVGFGEVLSEILVEVVRVDELLFLGVLAMDEVE